MNYFVVKLIFVSLETSKRHIENVYKSNFRLDNTLANFLYLLYISKSGN